jgi:hypothetical protein
MKIEHKQILDLITSYLEQPNANHLRFGQALFNLGIIEFANPDNPEEQKHLLRDIHNDHDGNIISRIKNNYKIIK